MQSAAPLSDPLQLSTTGNVGGFVIFRCNPNGQEAVVPLESRTANGYLLAFDNTGGTATRVAINSVSTQAVNIPVVVRSHELVCVVSFVGVQRHRLLTLLPFWDVAPETRCADYGVKVF